MNEFDEMKARDAVMRDPEFNLRILWIRQVLLLVFLGVGIVMTCVLGIRALSDDGQAGLILFPVCWTVVVVILLRGCMIKIKETKKEIRSQQQLGRTSSDSVHPGELGS